MHINDEGLALLMRFEGFSATPYRCPAGVWTIGYGHTRGVNAASAPITRQQAMALLKEDASFSEQAVQRYAQAPLTANQFSALACLTFNIGAGAFARSTLLKRVNEQNFTAAAEEFPRWNTANGQKLPGLIQRRAAERALFLKG